MIGRLLRWFGSGYNAAKSPPDRQPWRPVTGAATDTMPAMDARVIADRARDAVRNIPYARRIVDVWVANAVASGISTNWSDNTMGEAWKAWADTTACDAEGLLTWPGLQELVMRAVVESGECLIRFVPADNAAGFSLQVLEGDLLDWSRTELRDGRRIIQGIELDRRGRRLAYWLHPQHPAGPFHLPPATTFLSPVSERVPANQVLHIYRKRRPGQLRDVSWLAPSLWPLKDLARYEAALLRKAEVEACLTLAVNEGGEESGDTATGALFTDAAGRPVEYLQPGMIVYRKGSGELETINPTGGASHAAFAKRTLEASAVGAGLTYDQVSGDLTQANYSSLRAGKIEFRRILEQVQYNMLIPMLVAPIATRFAAALRMAGAPSATARHVPVPPEMVDPLKDTMALMTQQRAGYVPPQDATGMFGYEFAEVVRQIEEANAAWDAAGIILDSDPRYTAKAGSAHDAAQIAAVQIAATGAASGPAAAANAEEASTP